MYVTEPRKYSQAVHDTGGATRRSRTPVRTNIVPRLEINELWKLFNRVSFHFA